MSDNGLVKVAFCADVHLGQHKRLGGPPTAYGLNRRCMHALDALSSAVRTARSTRSSALVVCGDLFDYSRPEPQLIYLAQSVLRGIGVVIPGNHDQSSDGVYEHACSPLATCAEVPSEPKIVTVRGMDDVSSERLAVGLWCVPYQSGRASEWLPAAVNALANKERAEIERYPNERPIARVLVTHVGIRDAGTPDYLREARDSIHVKQMFDMLDAHRLTGAFVGNWHEPRAWEQRDIDTGEPRFVQQCGALASTGFDDVGGGEIHVLTVRASGAYTCDSHEADGPVFATVRSPAELRKAITRAKGARAQVARVQVALYVRWLCNFSGDIALATSAIEKAVERGDIIAGCAEMDPKVARKQASEAVASARSADSMARALASFIDSMPLDPSVGRGELLELCKGYLSTAKEVKQ